MGSQSQPGLRTVEGVFRDAIGRALKTEFSFLVSGRTDAGVHAEGQVGCIKIPNVIPSENLLYCLRKCLPEDIVLHEIVPVSDGFHPRFSARYREYHYLYVPQGVVLPLVLQPFVLKTRIFSENIAFVAPLLQKMVGTHDFAPFRCLGSSEKSTRKTVFSCDMITNPFTVPFFGNVDVVRFCIKADSFLYRMVRSIMGALFEVMQFPDKSALFLESLESGNRVLTYALAPAKGLTLFQVGYENPIGVWERRFQ